MKEMSSSSSEIEEICEPSSKRRKMSPCLVFPMAHGTVLERSMWSRLPKELLERVVAGLPMDALVRLRSVCKSWNAYFRSYGFAEIGHGDPLCGGGEGPWCLTIRCSDRGSAAVYDVGLNKWHRLPLPPIHAKSNVELFSSVGGFLCFKKSDNTSFFIYNPRTRSCHSVNSKPQRARGAMAWVCADESEGFCVVVVRELRSYAIYDSFSENWRELGLLPVCIHLTQESCLPGGSTTRNGAIYMLSDFPPDLVAFDTITGSWAKLYVGWPADGLWNCFLGECRGHIYMFSLQKDDMGGLGFHAWVLHRHGVKWQKVSTMPTDTLWPERAASQCQQWRIECLTNKDWMVFRFVNDDDANTANFLILYGIANNLWKRIATDEVANVMGSKQCQG